MMLKMDGFIERLEEKQVVNPMKLGEVFDPSVIYLAELLYKDIPVNQIDFSRFTLANVVWGIDWINASFNYERHDTEGLIEFGNPEFDFWDKQSTYRNNIQNNFLNLKETRRKKRGTFL